jgi:hypothetical protein
MYTRRAANGTWLTPMVVDSGNKGQYPSIITDGNDNPAIAYYDVGNADLRLARGTITSSGTSFSIHTMDSNNVVGLYPSIKLKPDDDGAFWITYYKKTSGDLKLVEFDGVAMPPITLAATGDVGRGSSLWTAAVQGIYGWGVAYQNTGLSRLEFLSGSGATPQVGSPSIVDNVPAAYISLYLHLNNGTYYPRISYYNPNTADLKFAYGDPGNPNWNVQTVVANNTTGLFTNLYFSNDSGRLSILYYNQTSDNVRKAEWLGGTSWSHGIVFSGGGYNVQLAWNVNETLYYFTNNRVGSTDLFVDSADL